MITTTQKVLANKILIFQELVKTYDLRFVHGDPIKWYVQQNGGKVKYYYVSVQTDDVKNYARFIDAWTEATTQIVEIDNRNFWKTLRNRVKSFWRGL